MLIHTRSQGLGSYGCMPLDRLLLDITSSLFYNQALREALRAKQSSGNQSDGVGSRMTVLLMTLLPIILLVKTRLPESQAKAEE